MDDDYIDRIAQRGVEDLLEKMREISKGRRYISDPSEAPEDAEVHEGPQGGYYIETEGSGAVSSPAEGGAPQAQDAVAEAIVGQEMEDVMSQEMAVDLADALGEHLPDTLPEGETMTQVYDVMNAWANDRGVAEEIPMEDFENLAAAIGEAWNANAPDDSGESGGVPDDEMQSAEDIFQTVSNETWSEIEDVVEATGASGQNLVDEADEIAQYLSRPAANEYLEAVNSLHE